MGYNSLMSQSPKATPIGPGQGQSDTRVKGVALPSVMLEYLTLWCKYCAIRHRHGQYNTESVYTYKL